eukprot:11651015-Ditylum_brightwellii.AAC.1
MEVCLKFSIPKKKNVFFLLSPPYSRFGYAGFSTVQSTARFVAHTWLDRDSNRLTMAWSYFATQ